MRLPGMRHYRKVVNYSRGCKSLVRELKHLEVLVSRKGARSDPRSEGSETTKVGSNEQELDTEAIRAG